MTKKKPPVVCMVCQKKCKAKTVKCEICSAGRYCSENCVHENASEHAKICSAIVELEKMEKEKFLQRSRKSSSKLPLNLSREIVRLVGERPLVNVKLDSIPVKCLWDTGSMVSIMNQNFFEENFPEHEIHSVEKFLENETLTLLVANNRDVP